MLLHTRLYPPPLRPGLIRRDGLISRLDQGLAAGRQFTLVSAPAGYGKTTLVRTWLEEVGRPYAWLALDRSDNYPAQFIAYLLAALQCFDPGIGAEWNTGQLIPEEDDLSVPLEAIINDLVAFGKPCILVLDDYQAITDMVVQSGMAFLMDHLPPNLHLIVITRQDPLLRLSIYRSRGMMTEVRLSDLRFSQAEVAAFLNGAMKLGLNTDQVNSLALRTEGWAAGLQLAGISLSDRAASKDIGAFIRDFTGDDRYVMDYLMDEVLSLEKESVQRFLLRTSILKQICAPLCAAILDNGYQPDESQAVLEQLERANQFIIPLDSHRQWYRYHHLFGELLYSRLQSGHSGLLPELHRRASRWYEENGFSAEAIDHALMAEDFEHALSLIESTANATIWSNGDLPTLLKWSKRLPEDALVQRPRLALYYARALFFSGQIESAADYLAEAERTLMGRTRQDPVTAELLGVLQTNQATFAAMQGEIRQAGGYLSQAVTRVPEQDLSGLARLGHALGMTQYLSGQYSLAQHSLTNALHQAVQAANRNLGLDLAGLLAWTQIEAGRLTAAEGICAQALSAFPDGSSAPAACAVYLALARIRYEQDDLAEAQENIQLAHTLAAKAGWTHILWRIHILQAQIWKAQGDAGGAEQALWLCDQLLVQYRVAWVERMVEACRARLALMSGDLTAAEAWAEDYEALDADEVLPVFEELTLAQVYLAGGRAQAALHILDLLETALSSGGGGRAQVEIIVLRALALWRLQREDEARRMLLKAAPYEILVRPFLDQRRALVELVDSWPAQSCPEFLTRLLNKVGGTGPLLSAIPEQHPDLIEPLSRRELEVLALIADGLSNAEIADRLYLSVNTLRAHTTHIYQKLDVHNRVQAVSRARQLGLLPNR